MTDQQSPISIHTSVHVALNSNTTHPGGPFHTFFFSLLLLTVILSREYYIRNPHKKNTITEGQAAPGFTSTTACQNLDNINANDKLANAERQAQHFLMKGTGLSLVCLAHLAHDGNALDFCSTHLLSKVTFALNLSYKTN